MQVTLCAGAGKAKRTVWISDAGVGLTPDRMPGTILSLNESNKLGKFYLSGALAKAALRRSPVLNTHW